MPKDTTESTNFDVFVGAEPDPIASEEISGDRGDNFVSEEAAMREMGKLETAPEPETPPAPAEKPPEKAETPPEKAETPPEPATEPEKAGEQVDSGEQRIPKTRFDQVNERRKLAEQRLKELEAELEASRRVQAAPPEAFDFDTAEQQYMEAVVDGEFDKAKQIRTSIRNAERDALAFQALQLRDKATEGARQTLALDAEVAVLQADYPVFDPQAEGYDESLTNEALDIHRGLVATGKYSPTQAIRKAAEIVAKANGINPLSVVKEEPEPAPVPVRETKPSFEQKVAAANAQPPRVAQGGRGEVQRSVSEMSEDEFAALPESTKRKLRGDVL